MGVAKKRNGALDFWKFIFAVIIVTFHGKNLLEVKEGFYFLGGGIGVEFFFLVSGCMMAASAAKRQEYQSLGKDTFDFMKHKILGLLPNVYVAWVIAFVVRHLFVDSKRVIVEDLVNCVWELLFLSQSGLLTFRANAVTWYLSAMLLAMFIVYPLLRKYKDSFTYIICPILFIVMMGFSYQNYLNLRLPSAWNGWILKGMYRALMETFGGCLCYAFATKMKSVHWTKLSRLILTVIEWGTLLSVVGISYFSGGGKMDWVCVLLLMIGITIVVSQAGYDDKIFSRQIFSWLGIYSFSLYLGHGYWGDALRQLLPIEWTYQQKLLIYLVVACVTGLFIMYFSKFLKWIWEKYRERIVHLFVVE